MSVSVATSEPGPPVPAEFLGLSFEAASLAQIASYAENGDLVHLLRSLGPGLLRFGGVTADEQVAWTDAQTPPPRWASETIDTGDLQKLATLASRSGWHVLLTVSMAHFEPLAAAREAAAAKAALGPWLTGIELGNEPDAYARHGFRVEPWTFVQYDEQVSAYREAIELLAPGIPLAGPDTSGSSAFETWGLGEALDQSPALLTGHHYPLGCNDARAPTIAQLLSPRIRRLALTSLETYVSVASSGGIPFRLDETNSVSCGGTAGISNTFASALWAVSYAAQAMDAGAVGINLQGNPTNCGGYTPVCAPTPEQLAAGVLTAQPEWYGLLMASMLIGDRPIAASVRAAGHPNVEADAMLAPNGSLVVLVIDFEPAGARPLKLSIHTGSHYGGAYVLSLRAPSLDSLSGVTLGARPVAADGLWSQAARLPHLANIDGTLSTVVPGASATMLTIHHLH